MLDRKGEISDEVTELGDWGLVADIPIKERWMCIRNRTIHIHTLRKTLNPNIVIHNHIPYIQTARTQFRLTQLRSKVLIVSQPFPKHMHHLWLR